MHGIASGAKQPRAPMPNPFVRACVPAVNSDRAKCQKIVEKAETLMDCKVRVEHRGLGSASVAVLVLVSEAVSVLRSVSGWVQGRRGMERHCSWT